MKNYENVLLGKDNEGQLIFTNINIESNVLSVSFNIVMPFVASDEFKKERIESYVDCLDNEHKWILVEGADIAPSELVEYLVNSEEITEIVDISLYDKCYNIKEISDDIYFESISCGQVDTRDDKPSPINKDFYEFIHDIWEGYHLKKIDDDLTNKIEASIENYINHFDKETYIINHLENLFEV